MARKKEEYMRMREEKERLKQEAIERKQRQIEEGLEDDTTNLPLELLVKQKMEDEIRMKALGAMQTTGQDAGGGMGGLTLATTQNQSGTT